MVLSSSIVFQFIYPFTWQIATIFKVLVGEKKWQHSYAECHDEVSLLEGAADCTGYGYKQPGERFESCSTGKRKVKVWFQNFVFWAVMSRGEAKKGTSGFLVSQGRLYKVTWNTTGEKNLLVYFRVKRKRKPCYLEVNNPPSPTKQQRVDLDKYSEYDSGHSSKSILVSSGRVFWCGIKFRDQSSWTARQDPDLLEYTEWQLTTDIPWKNNISGNSVRRGHVSSVYIVSQQ